jgi:hypothetical protein
MPINQSEVEHAFQLTMDAQRHSHNEKTNTDNTDHLRNVNKNQG